MSVPVGERDPSEMEFVANARKLQIYTIKKCKGLHKSYTFYIGIPLADSARKIHSCAKRANSINPTNQHEAQMRIGDFRELKYERVDVIFVS